MNYIIKAIHLFFTPSLRRKLNNMAEDKGDLLNDQYSDG